MSSVPFYIVDSFTQTRYAGNPAGVVLPDAPLTEAQMLAIAGELHLETAFVTPFADARQRLCRRLLHRRGAHPPVRP